MIVPVILAGGSGTRLWPLSRELHPKQLMRLVGDHTLLQQTLLRLRGLADLAPPLVLCNQNHRFMVAQQLREIDAVPGAVILEPTGRNTAPAAAVAALRALEEHRDPLLLVLPADHFIADEAAFRSSLEMGVRVVRGGYLVTFGVVPDRPETGYGYICRGTPLETGRPVSSSGCQAFRVERFVEKPDHDAACEYLRSGRYWWNSGMFLFGAQQFIDQLQTVAPEMVQACGQALQTGKADLDFFRLGVSAFESCPADSIDYAVMEKTTAGATVSIHAGWNDLGSWEVLHQVGGSDTQGNVVQGDVVLEDVHNSFIHTSGPLLAAVGLSDHTVVATTDAVLIAPRQRGQDVKQLVSQLKKRRRPEALRHRKDYRPWGWSEEMVQADGFQVKRLTLRPGAKISLQKHHHRAEHWIVVRGTARVLKGEETFLLSEDQSAYIPLGVAHRLENPGKIELELIEVRTGSYLAEDDIVRFDDAYGR